jgi:hypothetical protein
MWKVGIMTVESISQMPGTSLDELEEISTGMQEYIRAANLESRQAALDTPNRRGLMQRLFPTQYERERQRVGVQAIRQLSESKRELLEVFTRTQIEIARKRADALIAAQGMHLQARLARFANEKIHDLNSTVNESRERFLREMDPQFDIVERYQHRPELYNPAHASVNHQIEVYFASTAALLDGFIRSLRNKVGEVQR